MEPKSGIMALRGLSGSFRPDAASWVSRSRNFVALAKAIGKGRACQPVQSHTVMRLDWIATPWPWEIDLTVVASSGKLDYSRLAACKPDFGANSL